jgi:hypothetical protein
MFLPLLKTFNGKGSHTDDVAALHILCMQHPCIDSNQMDNDVLLMPRNGTGATQATADIPR